MATAVLTSKGQTTIPKAIRTFLKVNVGDRLEFIVKNGGEVVVKAAVTGATDPKGMLAAIAKSKPVSIEEMNRTIRSRAVRSK